MSINKQLYLGIFGICILFGVLCLILILLASTKLFIMYNLKIKALFNEMDTNIVSLNGENADLFGQLIFYQGKFETFLLRNYYDILNEEFGKDLLNMIIDSDEINNYFKFYTDNSDLCNEENSKCYFVFGDDPLDVLIKKVLYCLIPVIEISLQTHAYNKNNYLIFNKFHFYDKENKAFISYKYNKEDIETNFAPVKTVDNIINNIILSFLSTITLIQNLNDVKINELTNLNFFKENIYTVFPAFGYGIFIDPYYKQLSRTFHFSSFQFNKNQLKPDEKVNLAKINFENLDNYLSLDMKVDYLSIFSLDFIERNGVVFIYIVTNDFVYTASKSICRLVDFTNYTYSDYSIKNKLNFSVELLGIDEFQFYDIKDCFKNEKILKLIQYDKDYDYSLKILSNLYEYSYYKDINSKILIKVIRYYSPNSFVRNLINVKFYSSFSVYLIVVKIYNNILIINNIIDRITYKSISYITTFTFMLWLIIMGFIFIKLYLVADNISSPIRKLIKNISLSQGNFNNNENLEKIYYSEDKDINDLFQLCQKLIIGGFKKRNYNKKQTKLNVYNNISKVKTNNMIINENDIINQRNQKYNEIFEKDSNLLMNKEENFKEEIYHQYKNEEFDVRIHNYENAKIKRISIDRKEEIENIKNKDSEYKMFYYINKEIEVYLPYNNLYKCYYEEFSKKGNKKKKK